MGGHDYGRRLGLVIAGTLVTGFSCGYWIGHREVMGPTATLAALAWVPIVWLGQLTDLYPLRRDRPGVLPADSV